MHSSPFSKKHQARRIGEKSTGKISFLVQIDFCFGFKFAREEKREHTSRYSRRRVARESSPRVRGFETNASSLLKHSSQRVVG